MKGFFKLKIAECPEISSVTVHKVKRSCLDLIFKLADFILPGFCPNACRDGGSVTYIHPVDPNLCKYSSSHKFASWGVCR